MTGKNLTAAQTRRVQKAVASVPYAHLLGIELDEIGPGTATLGLAVRKELTQNHGVVHGGAIASLIDTAMAFAIISLLDPQEKVTTVDLTISYLRPVTAGRMTAAAKVVRSGRRLFVVSADVFSEDGKLASTALSTYIRL
ncbi:MAG TPA: PaaI family thioesterase [Pyrinomonadaceae bacterium]|jgi:acyl-CoA thioesterase|nr:PaaI family thioesterase [Pyrinomonadaceae bacterium]